MPESGATALADVDAGMLLQVCMGLGWTLVWEGEEGAGMLRGSIALTTCMHSRHRHCCAAI